MKKTAVVTVSLATIMLLVEFGSANPIDSSENPNFHDVISKPAVAGLPDNEIDLTSPKYTVSNTPDLIDTVITNNKKITGELNSNKWSSLQSSRPVSEGVKHVVANVKPDFEKPSHLPTSLKHGPERPTSLIVDLKPDSSTADSTIRTLEPVSKGEDAFSWVTSPDNLVTTLKPISLSTAPNVGSGKLDSSSITSESDSKRRENLATTFMPNSHKHGNKSIDLPATGEHRNGASDIGSSCIMVLLGIFLITGSRVT